MTTTSTKHRRKAGKVTRSSALELAAGSTAVPLVHVRSSRPAVNMPASFSDRWVPSGDAVMQKQVDASADKNEIEVQAGFSAVQKNILTIAAEAQAATGHDVRAFSAWEVHNAADRLELMDNDRKRLTAKHRQVNEICGYLAKIKGQWLAVPSSTGTQSTVPCGRVRVLKEKADLSIVERYPAKPRYTATSDPWIWDARGTMPAMLENLKNRRTIDQVIAWASKELEGFAR